MNVLIGSRGSRLPAFSLLIAVFLCGCNRKSQTTTSGSETNGSAKKMVVVLVPKVRGIDYFNACERGAREAAEQLGDVEFHFDGPTEDSHERQAEIVETWIQRRADVIGVACNDPDAIAPVLKKARTAGVHVITWDADADRNAREFFVNQAPADRIGATLVDVMASEAGSDTKTAIITSTLQAPNQNTWIKFMRQRIKSKYPKMTIVTIEPSQEKQEKAFSATQGVIKSYPEVKGVFAITSQAFPGAAEAVERSGMKGKVAVTGLSTPKTMKSAVHKDVVKTVVLWNPVDLGYLTVYAAHALSKGALKPLATELQAGRLGKCKIRGDEILLGDPVLFTKENIDKFDF